MPLYEGMANCQYCNLPSSEQREKRRNESQRPNTPLEPELPAWLESLRAGDGPPAGGPSSFSAADFVDDGSLPAWMRPERAEENDGLPSGHHPAYRPASTSAPNTDDSEISLQGFAAGSLIDEQSLPSWMQEGQLSSSPPLSAEQPQRNIAAASLVQPNALPNWLKNVDGPPAQSAPTAFTAPSAPQLPPFAPQPGAVQPPPGMPSGMSQPRSASLPAPAPFSQMASFPPSPEMPPLAHGFAARELLDQQSLPPWLTGQNLQNSSASNGQAGIPGSSLLEMSALPAWLREGGNGQGPALPGPATLPAPLGQVAAPYQPYQAGPFPNAGTQGPAPYQAGPPPNWQGQDQSQGTLTLANGNLSAASFIDGNALPEWLRDGIGETPGGRGNAALPPTPGLAADTRYARQGPFAVPPRVENMRVPNRPRGELVPPEESEAAANVFAMLGVASVSPQFPGQAAYDTPGRSLQQPAPFQGIPSGWQQAQPQSMVPQGMQQPTPGYAGGSPMSYLSGPGPMPMGNQGQGGQGGYAVGQQPAPGSEPVAIQLPTNLSGAARPIEPAMAGRAQPQQQVKPAKRGFLETVREWFSR